MHINNKIGKNLLFVPGGPWISGNYWDFFLNSYPSKFNTSRHILINHEEKYSKDFSPSIQDAIKHLKSEIINISKVNLIGHSYGAWLSILSVDEDILQNVESIILVNMPVNFEKTLPFLKIIEKSKHQNFRSNIEFSLFFQDILNGYFKNKKNTQKFSDLSNTSFMESNENLIFNETQLASCMSRIKTLQAKIEFIYSENDLIIGNSWEKFFPRSHLIEDCGHFPMLEKPEYFSKLLYSLL